MDMGFKIGRGSDGSPYIMDPEGNMLTANDVDPQEFQAALATLQQSIQSGDMASQAAVAGWMKDRLGGQGSGVADMVDGNTLAAMGAAAGGTALGADLLFNDAKYSKAGMDAAQTAGKYAKGVGQMAGMGVGAAGGLAERGLRGAADVVAGGYDAVGNKAGAAKKAFDKTYAKGAAGTITTPPVGKGRRALRGLAAALKALK